MIPDIRLVLPHAYTQVNISAHIYTQEMAKGMLLI